MQKSGQYTSVIDFLKEQNNTSLPITRSLSSWFKNRRFIGSKDRRIIKKTVWGVVRNFGKISHLLSTDEINDSNSHLWVSCYLILTEEATIESLSEDLFNNSKYGLKSMTEEDKHTLQNINADSLKDPACASANLEVPQWVYGQLLNNQQLMNLDKDEIHALLTNLQDENSTYIRTNTLLISKDKLMEELAQEDITEMAISTYAPTSIEIFGNHQLTQTQAYKNGYFDIQDHNSQVVSELIPLSKGENDLIIDYCAGAGGKSLALAGIMKNKGKIFAHDLDDKRLKRMIPRLKRSQAKNIQLLFHKKGFLNDIKGKADILLLDVPCSGSGTWKRSPREKWKLTPEDLEDFNLTQANILDQTKEIIAPTGKIIYITCSILAEENEMIVAKFLQDNPSFHVAPPAETPKNIPIISNAYGSRILSHKISGDSFFISILTQS